MALAMPRAKGKDIQELRHIFRRRQSANEGDLLSNFKVDLEFPQKIGGFPAITSSRNFLTMFVRPSSLTF
jgi:hypothetical protein